MPPSRSAAQSTIGPGDASSVRRSAPPASASPSAASAPIPLQPQDQLLLPCSSARPSNRKTLARPADCPRPAEKLHSLDREQPLLPLQPSAEPAQARAAVNH